MQNVAQVFTMTEKCCLIFIYLTLVVKEELYASTNAVNKTVLSRFTEKRKKVLLQKMEGEYRRHSHILGVRSDKRCRIYHCTGVKTSIYDQLQLQIKWRHSYYSLFNVFRLT